MGQVHSNHGPQNPFQLFIAAEQASSSCGEPRDGENAVVWCAAICLFIDSTSAGWCFARLWCSVGSTSSLNRHPSLQPNSNVVSNAVVVELGKNGPCQEFMGMRGSAISFHSPRLSVLLLSVASMISPATVVVSVGEPHHSSKPSAGHAGDGGSTCAVHEPIASDLRGDVVVLPDQ